MQENPQISKVQSPKEKNDFLSFILEVSIKFDRRSFQISSAYASIFSLYFLLAVLYVIRVVLYNWSGFWMVIVDFLCRNESRRW